MVLVKIFSTRERFAFSNMEERLLRRKCKDLHVPHFKKLFALMECDKPQHNSLETEILLYPTENSLGFNKSCCYSFQAKILAHFDSHKAVAIEPYEFESTLQCAK